MKSLATLPAIVTDATAASDQRNGTVTDGLSHSPRSLADLPTPILHRIFPLAASTSYAARLTLPLVCKTFHAVTRDCPEMWDTFEVMTGNEGALSRKSQVEYVAARAGEAPLSIGLTIAPSRMGAWESQAEPLRQWDDTADEGGNATARGQEMAGLNMVGTILSLMHRVQDLVLDVHDEQLEPALARAVLALFDDHLCGRVKRLTFLGDYQLDRILRLTTPLSAAPSVVQPALTSLRHLSIAYCAAFQLPGPLPSIETLDIAMITIESSPNSYPLQELLLNFPNLHRLEVRTTIDTTAPQARTMLGITSHQRDAPLVTLNRLKTLVLEAFPLTSSLLSSLLAPHLQTLELRDFYVGFDPRDIRFELSLAEHAHALQGHERTSGLEPLPFGTFLARHLNVVALKTVTLGGIPDMAVRMCVDFVKLVGEGSALRSLSLLGFEWRDWECLFSASSPEPEPTSTPAPAEPAAASPPTALALPHLYHIHVFLDHASAWASKGTVTFDNDARFDRQGWMDGLMRFAERRMNPQAVVRMFRESNLQADAWMDFPPSDAAGVAGVAAVGRDPARTVMSVELDAGYKDSYAFVHGAWKAMEREQFAGVGRGEVGSDGT